MIEFAIMGTAQPQGSKVRGRWGGVRDDNAERLHPWRDTVTAAARDAWVKQSGEDNPGPILAAVTVEITFCIARPRSHYGTGRNAGTVRASAPGVPHTGKPDLDKLFRAVGDSLTAAGVIRDDCQISTIIAHKVWDERAITFVAISVEG